MGDHHWSRARAGENQEALDYYRERSRAPGVAQGGGARNFYCMQCDGVIPLDHQGERCPHCRATIEGDARRYFNWVEIDRPPRSDARALLPLFALAVLVLAAAVALAWMLVARDGGAA